MPESVWLQSLTVQSALRGEAGGSGDCGGARGPRPTAWLGPDRRHRARLPGRRRLAAARSPPTRRLANLAVGGLTQTGLGNRTVVNFTSTANLTPAARSDRAARLTKAAL